MSQWLCLSADLSVACKNCSFPSALGRHYRSRHREREGHERTWWTSVCAQHLLRVVLTLEMLLRVRWLRKEGNVLFNNALNTFYLRLCGVRHKQTWWTSVCARHLLRVVLTLEMLLRVRWLRKEGNVLFNDTLNTLFTVIWHQTHR